MTPFVPTLDLNEALLYHDDNRGFLDETLRLFIERHGDDMRRLRERLDVADVEGAILLVHSLKNIAALLGGAALSVCCIEAESALKKFGTMDLDLCKRLDRQLDAALQSARGFLSE